VLGVVSALAVTGSMVAVAAPAHGAVTPVGSCKGGTQLGTIDDGGGNGLTDTTKHVTVKTKVLKQVVAPKATLGGTCDNTVFEPLSPTADGQPPTQMTPKANAATLVGSASCSTTGPAPDPGDPAAAAAYPLNGKISITMTQTHATGTDVTKPWAISGYVALLGITNDVVDVDGLLVKGASFGASVSGSLWQDPAVKLAKTDSFYPGYHGTGYNFQSDTFNPFAILGGCADGTPGTIPNPGIQTVLIGGGSSTLADPNQSSANSPLLGSPAAGLSFSFGE
jgi:hypothetical protein